MLAVLIKFIAATRKVLAPVREPDTFAEGAWDKLTRSPAEERHGTNLGDPELGSFQAAVLLPVNVCPQIEFEEGQSTRKWLSSEFVVYSNLDTDLVDGPGYVKACRSLGGRMKLVEVGRELGV